MLAEVPVRWVRACDLSAAGLLWLASVLAADSATAEWWEEEELPVRSAAPVAAAAAAARSAVIATSCITFCSVKKKNAASNRRNPIVMQFTAFLYSMTAAVLIARQKSKLLHAACEAIQSKS